MIIKTFIPKTIRRGISEKLIRWSRWPPVGQVNFGGLRRLTPISKDWGYDRGQPIDRYYIERFLARYERDIQGHVLEVGTRAYTRQFGGADVSLSDVLHVSDDLPDVTLIADLTQPDSLPANQFDCVILTQTVQFIYEVATALSTVHRILKPGGVLLITVPGIAQISRADMDRWGDFWRFTSLTLDRLLSDAFGGASPQIAAYGNVLAAIAFLHGIAAQELGGPELDFVDPDLELLIGGRIAKKEHTA